MSSHSVTWTNSQTRDRTRELLDILAFDDDDIDDLLFLIAAAEHSTRVYRRKWRESQKRVRVRRQPRVLDNLPNSRESSWYKSYVLDEGNLYKGATEGSFRWRQMQHRFGMQWCELDALVEKLGGVHDWGYYTDIVDYNNVPDKRLIHKHPFRLLVMCCLAILRGVISWEILRDLTFVPQGTAREFFNEFISVCSKTLAKDLIRLPSTHAEFVAAEQPYKAAGIPGAIGSIDLIRFRLWKCPYALRYQFIGKEKFSSIALLVAVAGDGRVIYFSGWAQGGQTIDFACAELYDKLRNDKSCRSFNWEYMDADGNHFESNGARILADNRFLLESFIVAPTGGNSESESRYDRMCELLRKDVERRCEKTKKRWRLLERGLHVNRLEQTGAIITTVFVLDNFILDLRPTVLAATNPGLPVREGESNIPNYINSAPQEAKGNGNYDAVQQVSVTHFDAAMRTGEARWPRFRRVRASQGVNVREQGEDIDAFEDTDDEYEERYFAED